MGKVVGLLTGTDKIAKILEDLLAKVEHIDSLLVMAITNDGSDKLIYREFGLSGFDRSLFAKKLDYECMLHFSEAEESTGVDDSTPAG